MKKNLGSCLFYAVLFVVLLSLGNVNGLAQRASGKDANANLNRGGGGSGGGGTTTVTNPLPTTAPAPGVLVRESFGAAELFRPTGGKGTMKETYTHTPISSFWVEYPGSKNTQWLAPSEGQTWRFCGSSVNPYEMFSPLQVTWGNGCVASEWFDNPTENPTALMPFKAPAASAYEVSINGYPAPITGKYLAVGLTNSSLLYSNLETSASVVLVIRTNPLTNFYTVLYELRANGMNGQLLASGETYFEGFNQLALRYDPVAKTVTGSVNNTSLGVHPLTIAAPTYAGFEGVAIADNFIVRTVQ